MREAASRGFWVAPNAPYGYRKAYVQDGGKKRPRLELDPPADAVVRRIFEMALQGGSLLDITRTLNDEGIASPKGEPWLKTTVHTMLCNEVYAGALVWGAGAKDNAPPVRVEKAFPAVVSKPKFRQVAGLLRSRAPKSVHPRRASTPYLLSGLVKCETCGKALTAHEAKGGQYTYYVCHSLLKKGRGTCETPRLNSRRFEELIVGNIWENILTESNIRDLVKLVDEEMDGVAREQRERLQTIEEELDEVRRRLGRIWHVIEITDLDMSDATERVSEHRERKEKLEAAAEEARAMLSKRRVTLDKVETITAFAKDMSEFLKTSELTESRAFIRSFVKEIEVRPGRAAIHYTIPISRSTPKIAVLVGGRFGCDRVRSGGSTGGRATSTLIAGSIPHKWALLDG